MYHLIDLMDFLTSYYLVAFLPVLILLVIEGLGLIKKMAIGFVACVAFAIIWVGTLFMARHIVNINIKDEVVNFLSHPVSEYTVLANDGVTDGTQIIKSLRKLRTSQEYRGFSRNNYTYDLTIYRRNEVYEFQVRSHDSNPQMKLIKFNTNYKSYIFTGRFKLDLWNEVVSSNM